MTFLFVLHMLAQQEGPSDADARSREPRLAVAVGFVLLGALLYVLQLQWNYESNHEGQARGRVAARHTPTPGPCVSEESVKTDHGLAAAEDRLGPLTDALKSDGEPSWKWPDERLGAARPWNKRA